MEDLRALAALVHETRVELRLTQRELARLLGVSQRLVQELELGTRDVRFSSVLHVLNRLGFDLEAVSRRAVPATSDIAGRGKVKATRRVRHPASEKSP